MNIGSCYNISLSIHYSTKKLRKILQKNVVIENLVLFSMKINIEKMKLTFLQHYKNNLCRLDDLWK